MKKFINIWCLLLLMNKVNAQLMRDLTPKEETFYKTTANFVKNIIPQEDLGDWTVYHKDDLYRYKSIAAALEKDQGPYEYEFKIIFVLSPEAIEKKFQEIQKKMEEEKDQKKILEYAKTLNQISTQSQLSIKVHINANTATVSDCIGDYKLVAFTNEKYNWGIDLKNGVKTFPSKDSNPPCSEKLVLTYGNFQPFKFFTLGENKGGTLVSNGNLKKVNGAAAFSLYNIAIYIEGSESNAKYFLPKINWKKIKEQIAL